MTLGAPWIHGRACERRSGAGTSRPRRPAIDSTRISIARSARWPTSAGDMQRRRFSFQASGDSGALAGSSTGARRAGAVSSSCILAVPDLEVEQRPEQLLVVLPALEVVADHAVEDLGIVVGARDRTAGAQMVHEELAQHAAEPLVDRDAEAD